MTVQRLKFLRDIDIAGANDKHPLKIAMTGKSKTFFKATNDATAAKTRVFLRWSCAAPTLGPVY
jgi:hypothetical protein